LFKKITAGIVLAVLFASAFGVMVNMDKVSLELQSGPVHNLNTGLDYSTIQQAIDAPETLNGHTILVDPGSYSEDLLVSKSITLTGTDRSNTIIDVAPSSSAVKIGSDNVTVARFMIKKEVLCDGYNNFTIKETRLEGYVCIALSNSNNSIASNNEIVKVSANAGIGIYADHDYFCMIENNTISGIEEDSVGIGVGGSPYCTVRGNTILGNLSVNVYAGIFLITNDTSVTENTIENTTSGILLAGREIASSERNVVYHNNFIDCVPPIVMWDIDGSGEHLVNNAWDNGYPSGGNYFSNYIGKDCHIGPSQDKPGKDAIGDTPLLLNYGNKDNYPLMYPWSWERKTSVITYDSKTDYVGSVSNSHLSGFSFDWNLQQLSFSATTNVQSFCIIAVPKQLLDGGLQLLINDTIESCILMWNSTHTSLYFEYSPGPINVKILGEHVTPILGDINGDHIVNILDAIILSNHFLEHYP
jgi:hypothetical protein